MKISRYILWLFFVLINGFFIIKYGSRQKYLNEFLLLTGYCIGFLGSIFIFFKLKFSEKSYKFIFFITASIFLIITFYINYNTDPHSLKVDRCSAMTVGIKALLNHQYPYAAIDHLGGRTSNLPALLFIGIPFYLLGDVGYLQTFSFGIMVCLIFYFFSNNKQQLFALLLLISSPAYWWEIYAKSDLMSNFILLLAFILLVQKLIFRENKLYIIVIALGTSAMVLTRLTTIIPLSLLLFAWFFELSFYKKSIFIFTGLCTVIILLFVCFMSVPNIEYLQKYNPFELQNRQMPTVLNIVFIVVPFIYSFYVKNPEKLLLVSTYFLLLPVLTSFIMSLFKNGLYACVVESYFDISYFNMITPFLVINLAKFYTNSIVEKQSIF